MFIISEVLSTENHSIFRKMSEGGRATLIIPSNLAYKDKGHRDLIPPYTTLIFEIELLKVDN